MVSKEEKVIRLLQYLRKFTDENNRASMPLIDYYFEQKGKPDLFGPADSRRKTRRRLIKELVRVCNTDIDGNPLPKDEWRLMYDGYMGDTDENNGYICNLYYVQPFSRQDVNAIISSIEKNTDVSNEQKKELVAKVRKHLSNYNYESTDPYIKRGAEPVAKKRYLIEKERKKMRLQQMIKRKLK